MMMLMINKCLCWKPSHGIVKISCSCV
jgi:hypothetical protein